MFSIIKFWNTFFFIFAFFASLPEAYGTDRSSSYPYISGDTFRANCDFIYDETSKKLNPKEVKRGSTIFVKTDYIEEFFEKIHPKIKAGYVLVTHNSDYPVPGNCSAYLE